MKRIVISCLFICLWATASQAQEVVPLTRRGEVYTFQTKINGRPVATIISSYSRSRIPLEMVRAMYEDSVLTNADFLGFPDQSFSPEKIVPGVFLNLRELVIGGNTYKNVYAQITGDITPFFALGQLDVNQIGPITFSDGTMIISNDQIVVVLNDLPADVLKKDTVVVMADTDTLMGEDLYQKGLYKEALAVFTEVEKNLSGKTEEYKARLFKEMAISYRNIGENKEMERYLNKAIALSDNKDRIEMQKILVDYYKTTGNVLNYEKSTLLYLKDYCDINHIKLSDCWSSGAEDAVIADNLLELGRCFEERDDFRKLYTYYYYSAAWGNETAQQFCQKAAMEYWKEPINVLSL